MKTDRWQAGLHCGALAGLALLVAPCAFGDETLRDRVHREYRQVSYLLVEGTGDAVLYLFPGSNGKGGVQVISPGTQGTYVAAALEKTRSDDARARVRGLTELAGMAEPAALDAALTLLTDPSPAVREEAEQLILDHPHGTQLVEALGLQDQDEADE